MNIQEKIKFEDLDYFSKRKILRNHYLSDPKFHKAIKCLAFNIKGKLENPTISEVIKLENIIDFLVEGFLVYEKIYNENNDWLGVKKLDPVTLEQIIVDGKKIWTQYKGDKKHERILTDNQILYFSYPSSWLETSIGESLYTNLISIDDNDFISKHVDLIVKKLSLNG